MAMLGTNSLTHFFQLPWKPAILRKGFKGVYCNCNENMAVLGTNYGALVLITMETSYCISGNFCC